MTTPAEEALRRALDYLVDSGLELSDALTSQVLMLIEEGMREHSTELLPWLLDVLPYRCDLPELQVPTVQPPLCRGSIHYPLAF